MSSAKMQSDVFAGVVAAEVSVESLPYFWEPAENLPPWGRQEGVALLHDVIEDSNISAEQ